jgi:hypothetical protein
MSGTYVGRSEAFIPLLTGKPEKRAGRDSIAYCAIALGMDYLLIWDHG